MEDYAASLVDSIIAEQEFFERTVALKKTLPSTKEKEPAYEYSRLYIQEKLMHI